HLLADVQPLGRVLDVLVRDLRDVDEPLAPAEVDEGTERGEPDHPSGQIGAGDDAIAHLGAARALLLPEDPSPRQAEASAFRGGRQDVEVELLAEERRGVFDALQRDVRVRTEGALLAELDLEAALHHSRDASADDLGSTGRRITRLRLVSFLAVHGTRPFFL